MAVWNWFEIKARRGNVAGYMTEEKRRYQAYSGPILLFSALLTSCINHHLKNYHSANLTGRMA